MWPRRRLMIAQPVSAIGRASASAGTARAKATLTLATLRIEITPIATPRKCEPESPMKILAGWKLKRRKPAHVPARAPDSFTASGDSLACVPAAVIKRVKATIATSSWNANLRPGLTDQRSSATRSKAARPETTSTPVLVVLDGTNIKTATAKPTNMASPPRSGVGVTCAWRPPGTATMPVRFESRIASGTITAQTASATSSGQRPGSTLSRRVSRKVRLKKSPKWLLERVWERELPAQLQCAFVHRVERRGIVDAFDQVGEAGGDRHHLRLAHATRGHQRGADANAARVELGCLVVRYRVPIQRDADGVGDVLHLLARALLRAKVDQHQVVVGAAAHQPKPTLRQPSRQCLGVHDHLFRVHLEVGLERLAEAHGFGRDRVHQRAALDAWEDRRVDRLLMRGVAQDDRAPRAPERLLRGGRDDGRVLDRRRVHAPGHEPGNVGHVDHERGADGVGDRAHAGPVDDARI